jgi:hypothetical protein
VLLLALANDEAVTSGAGVPPGLLRPEIVAGAAAALACGIVGFLATSRSRPLCGASPAREHVPDPP